MNIREIAKLAGVSVSTVSKVINSKDSSIGSATRDKVLEIVKKYNYEPYAKAKKNSSNRNFLLGLLLDGRNNYKTYLQGFLEQATRNNYQVIVSINNNQNEELEHVTALCKQNVDGVVWQRFSAESNQYIKYFQELSIAVLTSDHWDRTSKNNVSLPYNDFGYEAVCLCHDKGHINVGCYLEEGQTTQSFFNGFKQGIIERKVNLNEQIYQFWSKDSLLSRMMVSGMTAVVCQNELIASDVYRQAVLLNLKIPHDLSVVCLVDSFENQCFQPALTSVIVPNNDLGHHACQQLISQLEKKPSPKMTLFSSDKQIIQGDSLSRPSGSRNVKIVVVGNINYDTIINLSGLPRVGETTIVESYVQLPGGKGANQAVAAARLGVETYLIGMVGEDHEAMFLYNSLSASKVHIDGVSSDKSSGTGKAFIYLIENGESSIAVYRGSNAKLDYTHIDKNIHCFKDAAFCLLQLEMQPELVEYAALVAVRNGVKVLLKPSAVSRISPELLANTSILLPNENELGILCPENISISEKADSFIGLGVETVIVTLGSKGCLLCNKDERIYFPAMGVETIDSTGAADAFAAALAVGLAEGNNMISAVKTATVAAGLSTTKLGVQSALADKVELELYSEYIRTINTMKGEELFKLRDQGLWLI